MRKSSLFLGLVLSTVLLANCAKQQQPTSIAPTFTNVYNNTLKSACVTCHDPSGAATVQNGVQLDFSTQATAYSTLTTKNVTGQTSSGICPGVHIVSAGNPATSYLAAVLFASYAKANFGGVTGCTPYSVHLQDQHLSSDEQATIIGWIQNGTLNN